MQNFLLTAYLMRTNERPDGEDDYLAKHAKERAEAGRALASLAGIAAFAFALSILGNLVGLPH